MTIRLVLASASPARLATLRSAGIEPDVLVSDVDEHAVLHEAIAGGYTSPAQQVLVLARAKAEDVAGSVGPGALVLGCDSMLELDGAVMGKPVNAGQAAERWRTMRGRSGVLHTGHWLVDARTGAASAPGVAGTASEAGTADSPGRSTGESSATTVHFADLTDAEIDAYVATGEPLHVAGAFTIDGLGGPFVTGVEGDHHGVVGLSLPLLRRLLTELGMAVTDLWRH